MLYQLSEEEKVIKQLERMYQKALEDVEMVIRILMTDELTPSKINRIGYQQKLKAQLEGVLEALHNNEYKTINAFLKDSYTDAFVGTMYDLHGQEVPLILPIDQQAAVMAIQHDTMLTERKAYTNPTDPDGEHVTLYESLGVDVDDLKKTIRQEITRGLATGMAVKDIARNISFATNAPLNRAKTIARTESHRIHEASAQTAREAAKANGADLVKYWDSIMDGDTRSTHRQLDGQTREVNEPFELNGHRAMQPGDFGVPGMDINCRCTAITRVRYALSDADLKRMQQKAEFWELDKAQSFEDFKKKYLKAAETLKNQGKSGIIKPDKVMSGHESTPKKSSPNTVIDHVGKSGAVNMRSFYGNDGMKTMDINTDNHGNPKRHPYGKHGEHAHDYEWDENGDLKNKTTREISDEERERNGDIL